MYPKYRDVSNWVILDEKIIYDFGEIETPISIVNVLIGTLHYCRVGLDGSIEDARTPITRWITRNELYSYNEDGK